MRYAVIMAGGAGTRLWPLSRQRRPKQLLRLFGGKSLLRLSFERLSAVLPVKQIHVIAAAEYMPAMRSELPELPSENFLVEPCPRDTANAIGLAAHLLARKDANATMGVFTADHLIEPVERFAEAVLRAYDAAEQHADSLVTFGIRPRSPHTGFGYIQRGDALEAGLHRVERFKEKPDTVTAQQYLDSGQYFWNSGMFVWRVQTILAELERSQPANAALLRSLAADCSAGGEIGRLRERFAELPRISIDHAVMEKSPSVLVMELGCEWHDVGAWTSLPEVLPRDVAGNVSSGARLAALDATNNIVVSEAGHLVAAVGVNDLIIVHSPDVTLICRKEDAQRVKQLLDQLSGSDDGVL